MMSQEVMVVLQEEKEAVVDVSYQARTGINSREDYEKLYKRSIRDPAGFWADFAKDFYWHKKASFPLL